MENLTEVSLDELQHLENFDHTNLRDLYQAITNGLYKFNYHKNRELLEKAQDLFSENRMMYESARIKKEIGISYYKEGNIAKAIRYFEDAIDILKNDVHNSDISETLVSYMTSVGVGYYEVLSYNASTEIFRKCAPYVSNKISNCTLYRYYLEYAIACIYNEQFIDALELTKSALKYTEDDNIKKAYCYNNFGRCYWKMEKFEDCAKSYKKAMHLFEIENNCNGLAMIFNNLSMLYYTLKDYKKSEECINKCFELFDNTNPKKRVIYYDTYIRVALEKNDFGEVVDKLLDLIELSSKFSLNKRYILEPIEFIVDKLSKYRNEEYGVKLKKIIINLINGIDETESRTGYYEKNLLKCLGMLKYLLYPQTIRREVKE